MRVKDLLANRHRTVPSLTEYQTVADAISLMATAGTGALIVTSDIRPKGIFTRSDVMRAWLDSPEKPFGDIALKNAMTAKMITAAPEDNIVGAINAMLRAGIEHLPIYEDGQIVAMFTIHDLVANHIDALKSELEHLNDYIDRLHESYRD